MKIRAVYILPPPVSVLSFVSDVYSLREDVGVAEIAVERRGSDLAHTSVSAAALINLKYYNDP